MRGSTPLRRIDDRGLHAPSRLSFGARWSAILYCLMLRALVIHRDSGRAAVARIEVKAARRAGMLSLSYVVQGAIGDLLLPPVTASARADELWRHTCFEVFARAGGDDYYELNFAPSTQWAAYRFGGYRDGMRVADEIGAPRLDVRTDAARFEMRVSVALERALPGDAVWRLGLSAVIEEANGRKSYWALAHPAGKPDFHHADCFALELPET
jgi:hypothetical protein